MKKNKHDWGTGVLLETALQDTKEHVSINIPPPPMCLLISEQQSHKEIEIWSPQLSGSFPGMYDIKVRVDEGREEIHCTLVCSTRYIPFER